MNSASSPGATHESPSTLSPDSLTTAHRLGARDPPRDRRMAVQHDLGPARRRLFGEVLIGEAPHRGRERRAAAEQTESVTVGGGLDRAREAVHQRHRYEA